MQGIDQLRVKDDYQLTFLMAVAAAAASHSLIPLLFRYLAAR